MEFQFLFFNSHAHSMTNPFKSEMVPLFEGKFVFIDIKNIQGLLYRSIYSPHEMITQEDGTLHCFIVQKPDLESEKQLSITMISHV